MTELIRQAAQGLPNPFWMAALAYFLGINIAGFALMRADKRRAQQNRWRIAERTLLLVAFFGGAMGAAAAMWIYRHKTRRWYFLYGLPALLLLQAAGLLWLVF